MIWFLVYVVNAVTQYEGYQMMSEEALEASFYNAGDYYEHVVNPSVTLQILGKSNSPAVIARRLQEKNVDG